MVAAQFTAQAADISALSGRAKDLIGVATITTTITGALANDKLLNINKHDSNPLVAVLLVLGFAVVITSGFLALKPREWSLAPDAAAVASAVSAQPNWTVDTYYAQVAMGFLAPGQVAAGKTTIQINAESIVTLRRCVLVELAGLALLPIAGLALAGNAV